MPNSQVRMKIAFVIKFLSVQGGGAERVLVDVASRLSLRGHHVTVVTNDQVGSSSYYSLHPSVHQINMGIGVVGGKTKLLESIRRILAMRRVLVELKPDVVIGFMHSTYIPLGFALVGTGIPLIASEHTSIEHYIGRKFQRILLYVTPILTKKITVVSEQVRSAYSNWLSRSMVVIPNPVDFQIGLRADLRKKDQDPKVLLSVGGLSVSKNQKCLISAFATISNCVPDWNLRIVGEGVLRSELERQIKELGLEGRVYLPGATKNIANEYINAQLFVLPSSYESFGLATAEALVCGLPVVGFADCPGTNQLIRHNENGLLVSEKNRIKSLENALLFLMSNPDERCRLGSASVAWLLEEYGIENVLDKWESTLQGSARIIAPRVGKCAV